MTTTIHLLLTTTSLVGLLYLIPWTRGRVTVLASAVVHIVTILGAIGVSAYAAPLPPGDRWSITVGSILASTVAGAPVVAETIRLTFPAAEADGSLLPASLWIGVVERFAFTVALVLGLTEVAAVLLGVKALGVYATTSDNRPAAQRVMGTLTSVSWALLCYAVWWLAGN